MDQRYYFCGIAGSGMSALAQIVRMKGHFVEGSDRLFDLGQCNELKGIFEKMGIKIHPQNGNGITSDIDIFVYSTAVEETNPDFAKAKKLGIKIIHRSELLKEYVERYKTIAIAGTSGKTTLTALIWHIFNTAFKKPLLINGGFLISLMEKGFIGNAYYDSGEYLVVEADESDATITKYHPEIGIIHNITKDHKDIEELKQIFSSFAKNSKEIYINEDDPIAFSTFKSFKNVRFYGKNSSKLKIIKVDLFTSHFMAYDDTFEINLPGLHNISNALCAIKIAKDIGISSKDIKKAFLSFKGTFRRFNLIGEINGIKVIDDYAHNPSKITATLNHCIENTPNSKVIVIYQPHGFAPTRLFKNDLIYIFSNLLRQSDIIIMPEIYYVGGTVKKDISSKDIIQEVKKTRQAFFLERNHIPEFVSNNVSQNDIVIVMGARDPTLNNLAKEIFHKIAQKFDKI